MAKRTFGYSDDTVYNILHLSAEIRELKSEIDLYKEEKSKLETALQKKNIELQAKFKDLRETEVQLMDLVKGEE